MNCSYCDRSANLGKKLGITFHCFPKNEIIKQLWIKACALHKCFLEDLKPYSTLCSDHFTLNDFQENNNRKLKKEAVPTRFSMNPYVHCIVCREIHDKASGNLFYEFPEHKDTKKLWQNFCAKNGYNIIRVLPENAICSNHFPKECFNIAQSGKKYLKIDAVPSIFSCKKKSDTEESIKDTTLNRFIAGEVIASGSGRQDIRNALITNQPNLLEAKSVSERSTKNTTPNRIIADEAVASIIDHQGYTRRADLADNSIIESPPRKIRRVKVYRPARVGDLTEDHFSTPENAKRNFCIIFAAFKQYQRKLDNYRTKICRLQQKIKTLESLS